MARAPKKYAGALAAIAAQTPSHDDLPGMNDVEEKLIEEMTLKDYLAALKTVPRLPNVPRDTRPSKTHMVIPDLQQKPGADNRIMRWLGLYAAERRPDVIIILGDLWDMASLSSWDLGKASAENRRYWMDIWAGNVALDLFMEPIRAAMKRDPKWKPRFVFLIGNHEYRIMRWAESVPAMSKVVGYKHFNLNKHGFEVYDFLEVVEIDGIKYSHFFPRSANGKIVQHKHGAPNARLQVAREGQSCTAGHTQGLDTHIQHHGNRTSRGVIAGSCYLHQEPYMARGEGNAHWRGCLIKHEVRDGDYDLMEVSVNFLRNRFEGK